MSSETLTLAIIILIGFTVVIFFLKKTISDFFNKQKPSDEILQIIKLLQESSKDDRKTLLSSLQQNTESLNQRLDKAAQVIGQVQRNIGELSEIGRGMKDLQEFLRSPKLRGNIGEQILKELLTQMLPKQTFNLQYKFKTGSVVDAAITTSSGIVPIDSKFPMETFRKMLEASSEKDKSSIGKQFVQDVKKHILSISEKYILTDEGTIDYALMYIPSEAVYYEIVNNNELFEYASKNRVLPVSPSTFYAYVKAILMSFEGQKIEKQAREILASLKSISKEYKTVEASLGVLGKHLTNASNTMNSVFLLFSRLGQKIKTAGSLEEKSEAEPAAKKLT